MTPGKGPESLGIDWGAIPQGQHCVQVYQDESALISMLGGFVAHALERGALALVIATAAHRSSLRAQLRAAGHDLDAAAARGDYIAVDAAATLSRFMVDGLPDPARFASTLHALLGDVPGSGRPVQAFGEMVALLWAQGNAVATLRLEQLWNAFCREHGVTLYCAYPKIGATRDLGDSLAEVCGVHDRVLVPG